MNERSDSPQWQSAPRSALRGAGFTASESPKTQAANECSHRLADLLAHYSTPSGCYDEMLAPDGSVRAEWRRLMEGLAQMGPAGIAQRADQARRLLRENGVTYNVVGAPQGPDRPWELDPIPLLLPSAEWQSLAAGLAQRAKLLNVLLNDVFGPQRLLSADIVPPAFVFENPDFWHACRNLQFRGDSRLVLHACNLARQANGRWVALADRAQGPSGAGYALENRIIISRTLPRDFESLHIERLASFFLTLRETLQGLAPEHRDNPRVVLLSPGPRSSRYFEDGYLARYLGYSLVEGGDLTVRGERMYMKTLGGLVPVDVILRRLLDGDCDPLELRPESTQGTPGLLQTVRGGQLGIANAIGSAFVEAPIINAYLGKICRFLLNEDLLLECKPTWWCGDATAWNWITRNLDELLIRPAFVHRHAPVVEFGKLDPHARDLWRTRLYAEPQRYVVQQPLPRSATPIWRDGQLQPARVALRTFAVSSGDSYKVLPGGLCRVSDTPRRLDESASSGQSSKDVWILSDSPVESLSLLPRAATAVELRRNPNDVTSRVAENMFWLGRYAERMEAMVRHLRSCLVRLTAELEPASWNELRTLLLALEERPASNAQAAADNAAPLRWAEDILTASMLDDRKSGSLAYTLASFQATAIHVRDRLSVDGWRIVSQLANLFQSPWDRSSRRPGEMLLLLNQIINLLAAFTGLGTESMTRGPVWRFLDMGRRIERALQMLGLVRRVIVPTTNSSPALYEAILEIADSSMTYRHRYLASLQLAPLLDLLLVDETNPRAVGYQFNALSEHVLALPHDSAQPQRIPEERLMLLMQASLRLTDVEALIERDGSPRHERLDRLLIGLEEELRQLSDSINHRYLAHTAHSRQLGTIRPSENPPSAGGENPPGESL